MCHCHKNVPNFITLTGQRNIHAFSSVMSRKCQLITHLQLFTSEDTITEEMSLLKEPAHVAIGLQLLEMTSITTPNQTIVNVCTRYIFQRIFC